jgi:hypothetical protein
MQTAIPQQPATPCLINSSIYDEALREAQAAGKSSLVIKLAEYIPLLSVPWAILHLINANARVSKHFWLTIPIPRLRKRFSMPPDGRILQGNFRLSSDTPDISRLSRHKLAYFFISSYPIQRSHF